MSTVDDWVASVLAEKDTCPHCGGQRYGEYWNPANPVDRRRFVHPLGLPLGNKSADESRMIGEFCPNCDKSA